MENNFINKSWNTTKNALGAKSRLYNERTWDKFKGIQKKKGATPKARTFFTKAAQAATFGSGVKREMLLNSVGLLTRHQKKMAKTNGFMAAQQSWMMPAMAAFGAVSAMAEGGGVQDYVGDWMLPGIGLMAGWNVGKNVGLGIGAAANAGGRAGVNLFGGTVAKGAKSFGRFGMLAAGGTLGVGAAIAGGAAGMGAGYLVKEANNSNNMVNEIAEEMTYAKFQSDVDVTRGTLTHRQKTMSKLSKSGLNDRGQLLGNEAMIMAGII
ncbi:MAG: hypothetical protein DRQ78_05515 [Epsilonproteobacteria bacterium]|nr:MAG: hypothetical protein DRQ78_05515 [Campylobacterota bacterium]